MRDWRKLHKAILTSDRMPECSFQALWLWTLLTVGQDDCGRYPWTKAKVFALTAVYGFDFDRATELANELVTHGIAEWIDGGFIHLINGEVYNGKPSDSRREDIYQEPVNGHVAVQRSDFAVLEERRGEEKREEESASAPAHAEISSSKRQGARKTDVTDEFVETLLAEFAGPLGGAEVVRESVAAALGHKNYERWNDKQRYVRNWLERDMRSNGHARSGNHSPGHRLQTVGGSLGW